MLGWNLGACDFIVMSAKKDKSGKRRQGPLQIVVTGNMAIVAFSVPIQAYMCI